MTDLETFFQQFENWVLRDIRIILKLEKNGTRIEPDRTPFDERRPLVAAVILMCCAIDCLARFRFGQTNGNVGTSFKNFISSYLNSDTTSSHKSYSDEKIYDGLRNYLVHGYSLDKNLGLVHQSDKQHLELVNDRIILDVFSLYYDLEKAYEKYKGELLTNQYLDEFNLRWRTYPLIQYIEDENVKGSR
jgi:hypothetical protein